MGAPWVVSEVTAVPGPSCGPSWVSCGLLRPEVMSHLDLLALPTPYLAGALAVCWVPR